MEDDRIRLAELLAALSLGIDLGFGQPMEHVLRQCRIALGLGELIGADAEQRAAAYYTALLVNVGCHSDAFEQAKWCGDDIALRSTKYDHDAKSLAGLAQMIGLIGAGNSPLHRVRVAFDFVRWGHAEVDGSIEQHAALARSLGVEIGLPPLALDALASSYERWDGRGWPGELAGEAIPLAARIVQIAEFTEVAQRVGGIDAAVELAKSRSGKQFDPALCTVVVEDAEKLFHGLDGIDSWATVIDAEPALAGELAPAEVDATVEAIARFVDLKSPYLLGHSAATADLVTGAARRMGFADRDVSDVRRAALVSGFGRLGVSNAIWDKTSPLTPGDWERVRLQPQLTERMLHRSPGLAPAGRVAGHVRERCDGSGYPRGLNAGAIPPASRVLAAADSYQAMREPRPHRPAMAPAEAADELRREVHAGRLDADAVDAVLATAAGKQTGRRRSGPAGLTAREIEVLRLVASGRSTKAIAEHLVITPKTVGNHVEHIYAKIGVSNRAAASLYAMRHGLLPE